MAVVAEQFIARHITVDPHRAGVQHAMLRAEGYKISPAAVEAAIAYYHLHKDALDAVIAPTLASHPR